MARQSVVCVVIAGLLNAMLPSPLEARASAGLRQQTTMEKIAIPLAATFVGVLAVVTVLALRAQHHRQPKLTIQPPRLDFGRGPIGSFGEQTVLLRNKGGSALVIRDVSVSGECFSLSARSSRFPLTLSGKEEAGVIVRYVPGPRVCRGSLEIHIEAGKKGSALRVVPLNSAAVPAADMNTALKPAAAADD